MQGASDLVPMGKVVCVVSPGLVAPFDAATPECVVTGKDKCMIERASGYHSPGQAMRLVRDAKGRPAEVWLGGGKLLPKAALMAEAAAKYRKAKRTPGA